jgi:argininosuccinate lyase
MIASMTVNQKAMENAVKSGFMNATDAADYLVSKGIPFRDCHEIIGRIVLYCIENEKAIEELSLEELKSFSDQFEEDIYQKIDIRSCIRAKKSKGSTSFESVERMLKE